MPILVIEHDARNTASVLGRALSRHGLRLRTLRLHADEEVPNDLDGIDGVVTMGGPQSATDDALPWLAAEMRLLEAAHASSIPVLGICLGSQILARALGGQVRRAETPAAGFGRIDLTPAGREDPVFKGLPWFGSWPDWHGDEVSEVPAGGRILAGSDHCKVEAYACGIFSYGIQFHPEWTATELATRLEQGDDASDLDFAALAATVRDQQEVIDRQAERFAENVASYLMPIERVNAGVARDIHH